MASFEERFLKALVGLCDGKDQAILNRVLKSELGWSDAVFTRERNKLIAKGVIAREGGQGGKTKFANFSNQEKKFAIKKGFISYSHADEELKIQFLNHIKPLERMGLIGAWHDRKIQPGDVFDKVIYDEVQSCDYFFPLVSSDFLSSRYCYEIEMDRAIERHELGEALVVPIILRDCFWQCTPIGKIQAVPKDARPVTSHANLDEAFAQIVRAVHGLLTSKA